MMRELLFSELRDLLEKRSPRLLAGEGRMCAAVALVLHQDSTGLRLLFIERSQHDADPWSGHLAFPGGRREASDPDLRAAAERETYEEIGLDLVAVAEYLGRLDDVASAQMAVLVAGFVYGLSDRHELRLSGEVKEAFWIPLRELLDARRQAVHLVQRRGETCRQPAINLVGVGRPVLWGLTYRLVQQLLALLGDNWARKEE